MSKKKDRKKGYPFHLNNDKLKDKDEEVESVKKSPPKYGVFKKWGDFLGDKKKKRPSVYPFRDIVKESEEEDEEDIRPLKADRPLRYGVYSRKWSFDPLCSNSNVQFGNSL